MLRASLRKRRGAFVLDASLEVEAGATLVVVGESGAGKTSLLRLLAGIDTPDDGVIELDGVQSTTLPAWQRDVGYVPQDSALFPHLNALENVAFGLRARGDSRDAVRSAAERALAAVGAMDLAMRRPAELSGGQQQRVALARSVALEPRLLLLDEPMSALDLASRRALRAELQRVLAERTGATVYVTHSPQEARQFASRVAVLERGRIVQTGTPEEITERPATAYVADLMRE